MKTIILLGDGMADLPIPALEGQTPLEAAQKPNMDFLAQHGEVGLVRTVPEGMNPGSDTANLSVMGYSPRVFYTGRSPLEAVSMGIALGPRDIAMRCNLVTLSETPRFEDSTMIDYSAGEITTEEASELIHFLSGHFSTDSIQLYPGISYRHCLVLRDAETGSPCTPPHDISGKPVTSFLPKGRYGALLLELMKKSYDLLRNHPINRARTAKGLRPANSCWFWGEGTAPALPSFSDKFGIRGGVVSAVDLVKGIGLLAGLDSVDVPGATGNLHTNFHGKAEAALTLLADGRDFVYIHIEAPDECGHQGDLAGKIEAIERIDHDVLGPLLTGLDKLGEDYAILVMPDHPTPISTRTHSGDPVPFVLYRNIRSGQHSASRYSEKEAVTTGLFISAGHTLIDRLILKGGTDTHAL